MLPVVFASFIIKISDQTQLDGFSKHQLKADHHPITSRLSKLNIKYKSYTYLSNFIHVDLPKNQFHKISRISNSHTITELPRYTLVKPVAPAKNDRVLSEFTDMHNVTQVSDVRSQFGVSGKNIRVGIIDTGIDYHHPAFITQNKSRIVACYDFTGELEKTDCLDSLGHGSHVAGIVAGNDDEVTGVAPNALLGAYKVFREGVQDEDYIQVYEALEQAVKDKMNVINMSLGLVGGWDAGFIESIYAKMQKLGILILNANGNDGKSGLFTAGSPAVSQYAFAVAAASASKVAVFSSWGLTPELQLKPEIASPGVDIRSSVPMKFCDDQPCYDVWSGTSMASPYVAGCAALYMEHFGDLKDFRSKTMATAKPFNSSVIQQGAGMIQMLNTFKSDLMVLTNQIKGNQYQLISIKNTLKTPMDVKISHSNMVSVQDVNRDLHYSLQKHEFYTAYEKLTLQPETTRHIYVKITSKAPETYLYSGYVNIESSQQYSIPYFGYQGDYNKVQLFMNGWPKLVKSGSNFNIMSDYIGLRINHPIEALQIQIQNNSHILGLVYYQQHLRKLEGEFEQDNVKYKQIELKQYFENGMVCVGCFTADHKKWEKIPQGNYTFRLLAQRPMGNVKDANSYVEWTSESFLVE
eukprot:NODE_143_length_15882_cov_1.296585.p2 type:complete len:636 gc:universal NODE_143_length_15882_cov_1.296585:13140-11233(-)